MAIPSLDKKPKARKKRRKLPGAPKPARSSKPRKQVKLPKPVSKKAIKPLSAKAFKQRLATASFDATASGKSSTKSKTTTAQRAYAQQQKETKAAVAKKEASSPRESFMQKLKRAAMTEVSMKGIKSAVGRGANKMLGGLGMRIGKKGGRFVISASGKKRYLHR